MKEVIRAQSLKKSDISNPNISKLKKREVEYVKELNTLIKDILKVHRLIILEAVDEKLKNMQMKERKLDILTSKDVCSMLEISPSTLYRMRMNGLPYIKEEGRKNVLFKRQDVLEYMEKNKISI